MKIVKLNKTHSLFREGCTHAFRFEHYGEKAGALERTLERHFGHQYRRDALWKAKFGYRPHRDGYRCYWIGVKSECVLTIAMLALDSSKK
jgi:hypothetical protein